MYLCNAFSLQMVSKFPVNVQINEVSSADVIEIRDQLISAIGHADTAAVLSSLLGFPVPTARVNVSLKSGDEIVVAQYVGGRLPEGATVLPEGASFRFLVVQVA